MKYLLFDLTILLSFVFGAKKLLTDYYLGFSAPVAEPECNADDHDAAPQAQVGNVVTQLQRYDIFKLGDMVEVYHPKILRATAFPARIIGITSTSYQVHDNGDDENVVKFSIHAGPDQDETFQDIDISAIKLYEDYEFNTRVLCDHGHTLLSNPALFPCSILARSIDSSTYFVLAYYENKLQYRELPVWRIRRYVKGWTPSEEVEGFGAQIYLFYKRMSKHTFFTNPIQKNDSTNNDDSSNNELRGVAELYGETSQTADPVIILDYANHVDTPTKYRLFHILNNNADVIVAPEFVHPYNIYAKGTKVGSVFKLFVASSRMCTYL